MVRDIQLHHIAPQFTDRIGLGLHLHTGLDGGGARCWKATSALNFNQANSAGAKRGQLIGSTQARYLDTALGGGAHHRGALGNGHRDAVDTQGHQLFADAHWRAKIGLGLVKFDHDGCLLAAAKIA